MTFTRLFLLGAAATAMVPASAALPPNYQRLAELRAVISNAEVQRAFGTNEPIDRVEYLKHDLFRVTAGRCHMDVSIVSLPTPEGVAGPRRFQAKAGKKVCGR